MKRKLLSLVVLTLIVSISIVSIQVHEDKKQESKEIPSLVERKTINVTQKGKKKTPEERALFNEARVLYEYYRQVNPLTGEIPLDEKLSEIEDSEEIFSRGTQFRAVSSSYVSRGPSNLGGRTRSLAVDLSDPTGNTIIAGGVSGGVFRTTDGGANWTKVSSNGEIHNATAIAQDPRAGFQNIWYYGTGESTGNSANLGTFNFFGQGIWKSIDNGLTWTQLPGTSSTQGSFDSRFDFVTTLAVSPVNGELFVAHAATISRLSGSTWSTELSDPSSSTSKLTDVVITDAGRVFAAFSANSDTTVAGVWTSPTGNGSWTRIAQNGTPLSWGATGRIVLGLAPSNQDIVYALYTNGNGGGIEADLWQWNQGTTTWTDYSSKLPDETGGDSPGNDPFAVQGGYDLVVSVKPDNENFVVIGGTNAYRIPNITTDTTFERIGGYLNNSGYSLYNFGGVKHHPDIHALVFNPFNASELFSGTDGGVHKTTNVTLFFVTWTNLNNNYQTYQYYHVGIDPLSGSDGVIGGAQDNGTTIGGIANGQADTTSMQSYFSGDGVAAEISRDDACVPFFFGAQGGQMYRDCPTFAQIDPTGSASNFVTYFHLDPDNNNALYYAGETTLYRTTSSSTVTQATWDNLGNTGNIPTEPIIEEFLKFATTRGTYNPATSYLLMGGDQGGIYRLDDPQNVALISSAVDITPPSVTRSFPYICSGLAIHPTNPDIVMVTYANYGVNNIYVTTNATDATPTWTLVERNLDSFSIRSAAITETNGEILYFVGTARGLYSSSDPTSVDWSIEGPAEIGFALVSSLRYRPSDNKLLIGTHGNGMLMGTISSSLSVGSFQNKGNLKLYPNPATTEINFDFEGVNTNLNYSIFDLKGRKVQNGIANPNSNINVQSLQIGMYIVKLSSEDKIYTGKFIKK